MKKVTILILILMSSISIEAQQKKYDFSKEIDEQIWKSFVNSYNSRDGEKHIQIHTEDVLRITKNGIREGKVYRDRIIESYGMKGQPKREIKFKFEHRIHAENVAYEIGYFKVTSFGKEKREYFGRFSVVLKKVDGRWKIAQDWDIDEINGVKITKEDYDKLASMVISKN